MGIETALAIGGFLMSAKGQADQKKAQKKALAADQEARASQQKQQDLESARERRRVLRQARIQRATVIQAGENQGVAGSSAVAGAISSIGSQTGSNLSFLDQSAQNTANTNAALAGQSRALGAADAGAGLSQLGGTIFSNAGNIASIFQ